MIIRNDIDCLFLTHRWIYWTDVANGTIERVSVTGDGQEIIVGSLGSRCIAPIVLDYFAQVVHWIDNCDFSLRSATITGNQVNGNVRIVRSGNRASSRGLALYEDIIYWCETANVYGVNKTTGTPVELVYAGTTSNPFESLTVVHPNKQPKGEYSSIQHHAFVHVNSNQDLVIRFLHGWSFFN